MAQLNTIGERITYLRTKNKLTQKELMNILHFDNLSRYENNERKPPINVIIALAEYFNVTTDWILTGKCRKIEKELDDNSKKFLILFNQLTELEKGTILGRMEAIIENKNKTKN